MIKTLEIEAVHLTTQIDANGIAKACVQLSTKDGQIIGTVTIDITDTEYAHA